MERGYARRSARKRKTSSSYTDYQVEDDEPLKGGRPKRILSIPFPEARDGCQQILSHLMNHKYGWPFNQPVDTVALNLPDYLERITRPMDLGTIQVGSLLASC